MRRSLLLHPNSQSSARIDVEVARAAGRLALRYVVTGPTRDLRIPPPSLDAARTDGLWQHTCFEAFILPEPGPAYWEFNISPSTQWATYRFDDYRAGMCAADGIEVRVNECSAVGSRLELRAELDIPAIGPCRLGLSAVLEDTAGLRSYWALAHPPGKPDFHHPDCFALELPPA